MASSSLTIALFSLFVYQIFTAPAISGASPASFSSTQIKFWAENVHSQIPASILKKLSPLTQKDCDYYANLILSSDNFKADASFCSRAALSCSSMFEDLKGAKNKYSTVNEYNLNSASLRVANDEFSFFRFSVLKNGNLVRLPNLEETIPDRAFLPPTISSKIPLNLNGITKFFPDSPSIDSIHNTLSYCNALPIRTETKSCPKSLEEMVKFSKSILGGKKVIALTSKNTKGSGAELVIKNVKQLKAEKIVACHEVFLPFAAYFCHSLPSTNLYSVDLVESVSNKPVNTLLAICHFDTSPWPEKHVAFEILNLKPGQGEACHWFSNIDIAWIPDSESLY